MNRIITIVLLVVCGVFSQLAHAQEPTPKYPRRFLFIIETSSAMKRLAPTTRQSMNELVKSGLGGYMEDGDTIGVWTFNDELTAGKLPMQVWSKTNAAQIAKKIEDLLKKTTFEKEVQYQAVLPPLSSVVRSSPTLSILFITSGTTPLYGTPFDSAINAYYDDNLKVSQKQKIPFLTMFLTQDGRFVRHSVSPAIGDVKILKPLPPIIKPAQTNTVTSARTNKPKSAPREPAPSVVSTNTRGLVISGKNIKEVEAKDLPQKLQQPVFEKPEPLRPAPETPVIPPVNAPSAEGNAPTASTPVPAEPATTKEASPETKAVEQPPVLANSEAAPATTTQPVAPAEPAPAVTPKTVEQPVAQSEPIETKASPVPAPTAQSPAPAPTETQTPPPVPTVAPEPPKTSVAPQAIAKTEEPKKIEKAEVPPIVTSTQPSPNGSPVTHEEPKKSETASGEPNAAAKESGLTSVETATSTPTVATVPVNVAPPANNSRWLLIVGLALVLVAVAIAYFLGRQSAKRSGPSLITDSFDRTKK